MFRLRTGLALWLAVAAWAPAHAAVVWEVAVAFLGMSLPDDYQKDIDRNLVELARLRPGPALRLAVYREFPGRAVELHPDPRGPAAGTWEVLFHDPTVPKVPVYGKLEQRSLSRTILRDGDALRGFLSRSFQVAGSRRLLVLYGHGEGFDGMRGVALKELTSNLSRALPGRDGKPLDLLWLNACFMANVEAAYELKALSNRLMASEDAEFSAGAPFETLQDVLSSGPENTDEVAMSLGEAYIASYSYLAEGTQAAAVHRTSATLSVLRLDRLEPLATKLAGVAQGMKKAAGWRDRMKRRLPNLVLEKPELVDMVAWLQAARSLDLLEDDAPITEALDYLEADDVKQLKTNPRVRVDAPVEGALLVYGYDNWRRGSQDDAAVLDKLPANLKPAEFVEGPRGRRWPARAVRKRLYLTPFTVGFARFDFFFADPETHEPLTGRRYRTRQWDYVLFEADSPEAPILFSGYTQGIGKAAERFSGLSVLNPVGGVPGVDYLDLGFYQATRWGDF